MQYIWYILSNVLQYGKSLYCMYHLIATVKKEAVSAFFLPLTHEAKTLCKQYFDQSVLNLSHQFWEERTWFWVQCFILKEACGVLTKGWTLFSFVFRVLGNWAVVSEHVFKRSRKAVIVIGSTWEVQLLWYDVDGTAMSGAALVVPCGTLPLPLVPGPSQDQSRLSGEANSFYRPPPPPPYPTPMSCQTVWCLDADKLPCRLWVEGEKSVLVFVRLSVSSPCSLLHKSSSPALVLSGKVCRDSEHNKSNAGEIMKGYYWAPKDQRNIL